MLSLNVFPVAVLFFTATAAFAQEAGIPQPPQSWIDSSTQHRVIQLTTQPNSKGLYFNENAFTPSGTEMIYVVGQDVYVLDLTTYASRKLLAGPVRDIVVGHTTPTLFFRKPDENGLYAIGIDSGVTTKLADLPDRAALASVNADQTLIAGTYTEKDVPPRKVDPNLKASSQKANFMDQRLSAHVPMALFTVNLKSGEVNTVLKSTDWISHVQFSPKDPTLLMYCHEGLWWKVDRIWTVRASGKDNQLIHKRTVDGEIAGHEFWDADGVTIWYDLQIPRGQNFYLASYNTKTEERHWYSVAKDAWSIHYNAASDDSIFCGDGGDYSQVAKSKNGQWIELFKPKPSPLPDDIDNTGLVKSGFLQPSHLVNMAKQDYRLEPNVRFSPDKKWVIFTGNMNGPSYVYAVEVAKAQAPQPTQ